MFRSSLGNIIYNDYTRSKTEYNIEAPELLKGNVDENESERFSEVLMEDAFTEMAPEMEHCVEKLIVVLDCANIGYDYGNQVEFNSLGVKIAIDFFSKHLVKVVGFIPRHLLDVKPRVGIKAKTQYNIESNLKHADNSSNILNDLVWQGKVSVVPSAEKDDLYILSYARDRNGYVVSNDLYRDHAQALHESGVNDGAALWIEERRCGFTFVDNEFMLNPESNLAAVLFASIASASVAPMEVAVGDPLSSAWEVAVAHYESGRLQDALNCAAWILAQDQSHSQAAAMWQHCSNILGAR